LIMVLQKQKRPME